MHFEVEKDLNNKVFKIDIIRKFIPDEAENIKETQLENDFGNIEVQTGGLFEGYVTKTGDKYTAAIGDTAPEGSTALKFSLPENKIAVQKNTVISQSWDATKESKLGEISQLKVAELKCDLFALIIQKRLEDAVAEWKSEITDFETKEPNGFDISLS